MAFTTKGHCFSLALLAGRDSYARLSGPQPRVSDHFIPDNYRYRTLAKYARPRTQRCERFSLTSYRDSRSHHIYTMSSPAMSAAGIFRTASLLRFLCCWQYYFHITTIYNKSTLRSCPTAFRYVESTCYCEETTLNRRRRSQGLLKRDDSRCYSSKNP